MSAVMSVVIVAVIAAVISAVVAAVIAAAIVAVIVVARNCPKIIFAFDRKFQNSKIKLKNDPLKSKNLKKASNHKMSENRPSPNMATDSKTTFGIFKTQKSNSKKLKITKCQKTAPPPNLPILNTKNHWEGPKGPLRWPKATLRWPKATSPPQELEGGPRSGPNF